MPIIGARQGDRIGDALGDAGKMGERRRRLVPEPQRDPAGGELLLGAIVFVGRCGAAGGDLVGRLGIAEVEQFAGDEPPLDPPLVDIAEPVRLVRRRKHPPRGLGDLVGATQPLDAAERIAGIMPSHSRHRIEQRLGLGGFIDDGGARLGDGELHRSSWRAARKPASSSSTSKRASMRALSSAAAIRPANVARACASSSAEKPSLRQASRTSVSAPARSPLASSARASANRPLAVRGGSLLKKAMTACGSTWRCQSAASARRRKVIMLGQLGLAAMKAA